MSTNFLEDYNDAKAALDLANRKAEALHNASLAAFAAYQQARDARDNDIAVNVAEEVLVSATNRAIGFASEVLNDGTYALRLLKLLDLIAARMEKDEQVKSAASSTDAQEPVVETSGAPASSVEATIDPPQPADNAAVPSPAIPADPAVVPIIYKTALYNGEVYCAALVPIAHIFVSGHSSEPSVALTDVDEVREVRLPPAR